MTYIVGPPLAGGLPGGGGLQRGVACGLQRGVVACRGVACGLPGGGGLPGVMACRDGGAGWRVVWW